MFVATILISRCALARRCPVAFPRHAIAAKIRGLRRPPVGPRTGFGDWAAARGERRTPASVHRAIGMSPRLMGFNPPSGRRQKTQSAQSRPDRKRSGGDAFAAPLPAVRLRPMRDLFRAVRRLGRVAAAHALILSQLAPEGAAGAVRAAFVARYLLEAPAARGPVRASEWRRGRIALQATPVIGSSVRTRTGAGSSCSARTCSSPSNEGSQLRQGARKRAR